MRERQDCGPREDKTDWAAQVSFRAFGVSLMVRCNEARLMPQMIDALPPGWKSTTSRPKVVYSIRVMTRSRERYSLLRDDQEQFETSKWRLILDDLEVSVRHYVAEMSPNRVFIHAGVVGWRGKAIVFPGRSYSGKTSLVRELIRRGAVYYSDEYAVLDDRGRVHPYARSLRVRRKGYSVPKKVTATSLGAETGVKPLPVGAVIISNFQEGARWRPRKLTAGMGALEMLNQAVPARRQPDRVMSTIGRAVAGAVIVQSARGDVKEAAEQMLADLEQMESGG